MLATIHAISDGLLLLRSARQHERRALAPVVHEHAERRLDPGGAISVGGADCEKRWSLQLENDEPVLTIVGNAHKNQEVGMMRLRLVDGVWRGRWLWHERNEVSLVPSGPASLDRPGYWQSRAGTWDCPIFDSIVSENEYRLPARFKPGTVILDVGAHVGSFSFACLRRGVARVHAYEASAGNYQLAEKNLALHNKRAEVHRAAVWQPGFDSLAFCNSADPANTGGGGCTLGIGETARASETVPAVPLDTAIEHAAEGFGRVSLLKLDCEGGEFPALLTSQRLDLVDYVLGEFHEYKPAPGDVAYVSPQWPVYNAEALRECLESAGFNVTIERDSERLGHFWAGRPGVRLSY